MRALIRFAQKDLGKQIKMLNWASKIIAFKIYESKILRLTKIAALHKIRRSGV